MNWRLPAFAYMPGGINPDGSIDPDTYNLGWEYAKTITPDLGVSIGSDGYTWQRNPSASGWANIETQMKYVFYQNAEHEFIVAGATSVEWGSTGSPASSSLPSDPFTTVTPKVYIGKGFGDLAERFSAADRGHRRNGLFDSDDVDQFSRRQSQSDRAHLWRNAAIQPALYELLCSAAAGSLQQTHSGRRSHLQLADLEHRPVDARSMGA